MQPTDKPLDDLIDLLCMAKFDWPRMRHDLALGCKSLAETYHVHCPHLPRVLNRFAVQCATALDPPTYLEDFINLLGHAANEGGKIDNPVLIPAPLAIHGEINPEHDS